MSVCPDFDFDAALEGCIPRLRRYARALARDSQRAEDLLQSAIVRLITKKRLYREDTNFPGWAMVTLHREFINGLRRDARQVQVAGGLDAAAGVPDPTSDPLQALALRDLSRSLARLPDEQREALELIALRDLDYREAARVLDVPIATVRSRLSRARTLLRAERAERREDR